MEQTGLTSEFREASVGPTESRAPRIRDQIVWAEEAATPSPRWTVFVR